MDEVNIGELTEDFCKAIEKYPNLNILSINDCNIERVERFPMNDSLEKLMMCGNKFTEISCNFPKNL